jgi:hypothetical protein|tara:strand:- start:1294 stop:1434 length:141 start_codon:yes stop_codon:yes gene_type:complete
MAIFLVSVWDFFGARFFFGASDARRRRLDQIVCAPRELQTAAIVGV